MKTSAVGVREGRRKGRRRRALRAARGCSVGCRPEALWPIALLTAPRAGSLPQGHVPLFSLIARRAHCKRLITAFPDQAATVHLPSDGRGKGARCSASKSRPRSQQSSFQKTRAWRPRPHPLGTAPECLRSSPLPTPCQPGREEV